MGTVQTDYSPAELMAIVMARSFRDGEVGAAGANSQIPMAALRLAQLMHAPSLTFLLAGSGALNPRFAHLRSSAGDYRNLQVSEYRYSMDDVVDLETSGRITFGTLGGMQVDRRGRLNMVEVTSNGRTVRGPGTVGLIFGRCFQRVYLFIQHHDPRILVEEVNFVSGCGGPHGEEGWGSGPCMLVTPLAVFDFEGPDGTARLASYHPWSSVDEVVAQTGFELAGTTSAKVTEEPNDLELTLLRRRVDPDGMLRRLIARP